MDSKKEEGTSFEIYLPASEKKVGKALESSEQIVEGSEKFKK